MRVAAVDIGTNTARLLITDGTPGLAGDVVRLVEVVGLGSGLDASGRIGEGALERLGDTLRRFREAIASAGVDRVGVVATSAARDAANADRLVALVEEMLGEVPEIVSGDEEAALAFAGATLEAGSGPVAVIDPGGGSTEFVFGSTAVEYSISVDIGSLRLSDRLLPHRPASTAEISAARRHAAALFASVALPSRPARIIGVAGTFTSLAAMHLGLERYDRAAVHLTRMPLAAIDSLADDLGGLTVEATAAIPSLDPKRAPVILAGAIVAAEAVRAVESEVVTVSETDSLDGLALRLSRG